MNQIEALSQKLSVPVEKLQEYDQKRSPLQKTWICQYWLRGTCCFPPDFCHFAHGIDHLNYNIESAYHYLPFLDDQHKYTHNIKAPKKCYVLFEAQKDPFVAEQLKKCCLDAGIEYQEEFSFESFVKLRPIKLITLTFMLLKEVEKFFKRILQILGVNMIPKKVFAHELTRTGFAYMGIIDFHGIGSTTARPYTLIYHLQSWGTAFQKHIETNLQLPSYDEFEKYLTQRNRQSKTNQQPQQEMIEGDKLVQRENIPGTPEEQAEPTKEAQEEPEDQENQDEAENENENDERVANEESGKILYIIKVENLPQLYAEYTALLKEIISANPQLKQITDFDIFLDTIDEHVVQRRQGQPPFPSLFYFLRLISTSWDSYSKKEQIEGFKFYNSAEPGVSIIAIKKSFTPEQVACLDEYLSRPSHKNFFCQYWLRGICIFQKRDCRFAHGLEELQLNLGNKVDVNALMTMQQPLRFNQRPLITHRTYRILYLYQFNYKNENIWSQFLLDNVKLFRDQVRSILVRDVVLQIFKQLQVTEPIPKSELLKIYEQLGLFQKGGIDANEKKVIQILQSEGLIFEKEVIQEVKVELQQEASKKDKKKAVKKIVYLVPLKSYEVYKEEFIKRFVTAIILEIAKTKRIPLNSNVFKQYFPHWDKELQLPAIYTFLRMKEDQVYTPQDFLQLFVLPRCKAMLKESIEEEIFNQIADDAANLIEFEQDPQRINEVINEVYMQVSEKKSILNLERLQVLVSSKLTEQKLVMQPEKLRQILNHFLIIEKGLLLACQNGPHYLINTNQVMKAAKEVRFKKCKCGGQNRTGNELRAQDDAALSQMIDQLQPLIDPEVRNTIIVDDELKLEATRGIYQECSIIAVDLEGRLKPGDIWLVQIGIQAKNKRLIIIYDLQRAKYLDKNEVFYTQMISFIQEIFENPKICKVFHDCKRDSQALHKNGICTQFIGDTSSAYMIAKQIGLYEKYFGQPVHPKKMPTVLSQYLRDVQQVATPPLNRVLEDYNALNGGNELKLAMKENFKDGGQMDFFARPNPEFMYYGARDVEDLVEVYLKMLELINKKMKSTIVIEKFALQNKSAYSL